MKFTVRATELHRALAMVAPFAGTNNTFPVMMSVHFRVEAGVLHIQATNRVAAADYALDSIASWKEGHATIERDVIVGRGGWLDTIKAAAKAPGRVGELDEVTVTAESQSATLTTHTGTQLTTWPIEGSHGERAYPELLKLWPAATGRKPATVEVMTLDAYELERFTKVAKIAKGSVRMMFYGAVPAPIEVSILEEPRFSGLLMQMKVAG